MGQLGGTLDFLARDRSRLNEVLALPDEELIAAVGGRRRAELAARRESAHLSELDLPDGVEAVCRHDRRYPERLGDRGGPRMLWVLGGVERLARLCATPIVHVAGSSRPSDYGIEIAASLGRGLAAAGVVVMTEAGDGIAAAATAAALQAAGRCIVVMDRGLLAPLPAARRRRCRRLASRGCLVSELPCGAPGRMWGAAAAERVLARLARLTVVVEATDSRRDRSIAVCVGELGGSLAAVPGRVTSPLSAGTNTLLVEGAQIVRGTEDVLDVLHLPRADGARPAERPSRPHLPCRLRRTLEDVGCGWDTPEKLVARGADMGDVLLALSELELMGLLRRGAGGRYVPAV